MTFAQSVAYRFTQGAADGGYFQAMREAVVDEDGPGKGKDLGLVLQPPESRGEDDAIVISQK
jgi:hypothetical protein